MKPLIIKYLKPVIGLRFILSIAAGAIIGYAYYYFIGCSSGTCPITANPYSTTIWGMLMGGILGYKENK